MLGVLKWEVSIFVREKGLSLNYLRGLSKRIAL